MAEACEDCAVLLTCVQMRQTKVDEFEQKLASLIALRSGVIDDGQLRIIDNCLSQTASQKAEAEKRVALFRRPCNRCTPWGDAICQQKYDLLTPEEQLQVDRKKLLLLKLPVETIAKILANIRTLGDKIDPETLLENCMSDAFRIHFPPQV
jgi:hypothetical protein